jgi:threonine dehydratase
MMVAGDTGDGRHFISPFANRHVAAGQGTVGLEILAEIPEPSVVLIPIGGGGLALGIATAIRARSPKTKLVGVVAHGAPAFRHTWTTGKAELMKSTSIADGLCAPIADAAVTRQLKGLLDELAVLQDADILAAVRILALEDKVVAEPAGAAATAAALKRSDLGQRAVAVVSGGNVKPELLAQVLR